MCCASILFNSSPFGSCYSLRSCFKPSACRCFASLFQVRVMIPVHVMPRVLLCSRVVCLYQLESVYLVLYVQLYLLLVYAYMWCARIYMHRFPRMYILTPQKTSKKNFCDLANWKNQKLLITSSFPIGLKANLVICTKF